MRIPLSWNSELATRNYFQELFMIKSSPTTHENSCRLCRGLKSPATALLRGGNVPKGDWEAANHELITVN
jgi:hypothetical protein